MKINNELSTLKFNCTFIKANLEVKDIYIEFKLPDNDYENIYALCSPSSEQVKQLANGHTFSIIGSATNNYSLYQKCFVKEAFIKEISSSTDKNSIKTFQIIFQFSDLFVEYESDISEAKEYIHGWYYISFLASLSPHKVLDGKPSGAIEVLPYKKYDFSLDENFMVSFDTRFIYDVDYDVEHKNQERVAGYSFNVAEFFSLNDFKDINYYSILLDDFLMLMSFAIRKRIVCTGWIADNNKKTVKYIKRNIVIPEYKEENYFPNYLVEPNELANFLIHSFSKLKTLNHKDLIERAIYPLQSEELSTESYFLILFSCLESILLYHRKNKNMETIIDEEDFRIVRNSIIKLLKQLFKNPNNNSETSNEIEIFKKYDSSRRSMVYDKISELNRPSFNSIMRDFCNDYSLNLEDLWPLSDSSEGIPLIQIRNKLIHGDTFTAQQSNSLIIAMYNLRATGERMILKVLDWDIEKTRVSKSNIGNSLVFHENIKDHMKLLENDNRN